MPQLFMISVFSSGRIQATVRLAALLPILLIILSGCQSMPPKHIEVSPSSSVLGVDVSFPVAWSPDPELGVVFFIKEPPGGGHQEVIEVIPASWTTKTRAYLLNPEPGTYYVAAATLVINVPTQGASTSVGGGVSVGVSAGGSFGHTIVLTEEMIQETKTTIDPSSVEFMGALRLRLGDRINAKAEFQDDLQRHFAEVIRPGAVSATGLSGYMTMTWMVDLEKSSVTDTASDREKFSLEAADDFAESPWSQIVPAGLERR
jgi:hypothetical protein